MKSREFSVGRVRTTVAKASLLALGFGALGTAEAACGQSASAIAKLPAAERVWNDYAQDTNGTDSCLFGTVYDPYAEWNRSAGSTVSVNDGVIEVTPDTHGVILHLVNKGGNIPLQPADEATREVLNSYGCDSAAYPDNQ